MRKVKITDDTGNNVEVDIKKFKNLKNYWKFKKFIQKIILRNFFPYKKKSFCSFNNSATIFNMKSS